MLGCLWTKISQQPLGDLFGIEADDAAYGQIEMAGGFRVILGQIRQIEIRMLSEHQGVGAR